MLSSSGKRTAENLRCKVDYLSLYHDVCNAEKRGKGKQEEV